jgi:hypothetical protein
MDSRLAFASTPLARLGMTALLFAALAGCGRGRGTKHAINLTPNPLGEARGLLESYAGGQQVGSELTFFDDLVTRVTAADAAKGAKLKAFCDEVAAKGAVDKAKAKALLDDF